MNHTTKPWEVIPPDKNNPSRIRVAAINRCVDIYDAPLTHETEANAKLIAAAPEMLETLLEIAKLPGFNQVICVIEKAIGKTWK